MALKKDPLTGRLYHQAISDPQRTRWAQTASGGGPPAPANASYVTVSPEAALPNERVLTAGTAILITDGGPGTTITVAVDVSAIPHGSLSGLTTGDAGHTQFWLLAGRAGGQIGFGGTALGERATINANSSGAAAGGVDLQANITTASSSNHHLVTIGASDFTKSGGRLVYIGVPANTVTASGAVEVVPYADLGTLTGSSGHTYEGLRLARTFGATLSEYYGTFNRPTFNAAVTDYYDLLGFPIGSSTITNRYGLAFLAPGGTVTQDTAIAVRVPDQSATTLITVIDSALTAGAGKFHLHLTGDAPALFGGQIRLQEPAGANYSAFVAQAQTGDVVYILPAADSAGALTSDGAGNLSWVPSGGTGTVTSVDTTQPAAGLTITGGPITTSGTFVFTLANDLAALEAMSGTGFVARTASETYAQRTFAATAPISITNGAGIAGNPSITHDASGVTPGTYGDSTNVAQITVDATGHITAAVNVGITTGGTGTVTSVAATAPAAGFTISGSPITTSGTFVFTLADDLAALEGLSGTGIAVRTAANTWTTRTITATAPISISNGGGVAAAPNITHDTTAVTPGSYTSANITVDATGHITAAANGGGSTSPGGANTQVQFNDSGAFGGDSGFTFIKATNVVGITDGRLDLLNTGTATPLRFYEPSGSGTNFSSFAAQAQAADIIYTLPKQAPTSEGQKLMPLLVDKDGILHWGIDDDCPSNIIGLASFSTADSFVIHVGKPSGLANEVELHLQPSNGVFSPGPVMIDDDWLGGLVKGSARRDHWENLTVGNDLLSTYAGIDVSGVIVGVRGFHECHQIAPGAAAGGPVVGTQTIEIVSFAGRRDIGNGDKQNVDLTYRGLQIAKTVDYDVGANGKLTTPVLWEGVSHTPSFGNGTATVTVADYRSITDAPVVGANGVLTLRRLAYMADVSGAGSQDTVVGLDVDDQTATTAAIAVRSDMASGTGKFFLSHTGTAPSLIGGELRWQEPAGSSYVGFVAPALSANTIWTLPTTDSSGTQFLRSDGAGNLSWATPSGTGAPASAQYLTLALDAGLSAERVFTVGHGLDGTDGGANGNFTLDVDESELDATLIGSGQALTKTDDTNVTLTLGGTPTTALLKAASLTLGWTGQLAIARGGTAGATALAGFNNLSPLTTRGDLLTRDATNNIRLAIGTTGKFLKTDGTDPSWQSITAGDVTSGAALTRTDDTNVTLTLGGSPTTALLAATSLTLGWTGTLAVARGGTGSGTALGGFNNLSPLTTRGDLLTRDASNNIRLAVGASARILQSDGTDPSWVAVSGDATIAAGGAVTVSKINGVAYNADPLTQYTLLAGRTGSTNDTILSTSTVGKLTGSTATGTGSKLAIRASSDTTKCASVTIGDNIAALGTGPTYALSLLSGNLSLDSATRLTFLGLANLNGVHATYTVTQNLVSVFGGGVQAVVLSPTVSPTSGVDITDAGAWAIFLNATEFIANADDSITVPSYDIISDGTQYKGVTGAAHTGISTGTAHTTVDCNPGASSYGRITTVRGLRFRPIVGQIDSMAGDPFGGISNAIGVDVSDNPANNVVTPSLWCGLRSAITSSGSTKFCIQDTGGAPSKFIGSLIRANDPTSQTIPTDYHVIHGPDLVLAGSEAITLEGNSTLIQVG